MFKKNVDDDTIETAISRQLKFVKSTTQRTNYLIKRRPAILRVQFQVFGFDIV